MNNILICKHCNKSIGVKQMGRHLLKIHKQSYQDYVKTNLEEFKPFGWKLCIECGSCFKGFSKKCGVCFTKKHNIKENQNVICRICNTNIHSKVISIHLNKHHNIKFLDYVKENLLDFEKFGWRKCFICGNITHKQGNKHEPTCSVECKSRLQSIKYTGRKGHSFTEEEKQKIGDANRGKQPFLGKQHTKETKRKISEFNKQYYSIPENNPMFGKTHTPDAIKKIFSRRPMNKLEKKVADELKRNGVEYTFQFFIVEGEVCKSYDFKIKGKPIIIEVDGDFWHGNPNSKNHYEKLDEVKINDLLKDIIASERGYKVIRLWESDINKDISIVMNSLK